MNKSDKIAKIKAMIQAMILTEAFNQIEDRQIRAMMLIAESLDYSING